MSDLWTTASTDAQQEDLERRLTAARLAAAPIWPFLAAAESYRDFANRMALADDRIARVASNASGNDPVLFGVVHSTLRRSFQDDFKVVHSARLEERRAAKEAVRKQAEEANEAAKTAATDKTYLGRQPDTGDHPRTSSSDPLCLAESLPFAIGDCVRIKGHEGYHQDANGYAWSDSEKSAAKTALASPQEDFDRGEAEGKADAAAGSDSKVDRTTLNPLPEVWDREGGQPGPWSQGYAKGYYGTFTGARKQADFSVVDLALTGDPAAKVTKTVPSSEVLPGYWDADADSAYAVLMDHESDGTQRWHRASFWAPFGHEHGWDRVARIASRKQAAYADWPRVPSLMFPGETVPSCPKCGSTSISIFALPAYQPGTRGMPGGPTLIRCDSCGYSEHEAPKAASRKQAGAGPVGIAQEATGDPSRTWVVRQGETWIGAYSSKEEARASAEAQGFTVISSRKKADLNPPDALLWTQDQNGGFVSQTADGGRALVVPNGTTWDWTIVKGESVMASGTNMTDEDCRDDVKAYLAGSVTASRRTAGDNPFPPKKNDSGSGNPFAKKDGPSDSKDAESDSKDTSQDQATWTCPACGSNDAYTQGGKDLQEALDANEPIKCGSCGNIDNSGGQGDGGQDPTKSPQQPPTPPAQKEAPKQSSRRLAFSENPSLGDGSAGFDASRRAMWDMLRSASGAVQGDRWSEASDAALAQAGRAIHEAYNRGWDVAFISNATLTSGDAILQVLGEKEGSLADRMRQVFGAVREASRKTADGDADGTTPMYVVLDGGGAMLAMYPTEDAAEQAQKTFNGPTTIEQRSYRFASLEDKAARRRLPFAREAEANPYQPTSNPYVTDPPIPPGMPDDQFDGPQDNPLTRTEPPKTTRPRQEPLVAPSGAPADYSTQQGFTSALVPDLVQER